MNDMVPCFELFCESECFGAPLVEVAIDERGQTIPQSEWEKTFVRMRSQKGLNYGKDSEETLIKYVPKEGVIGRVATMNVVVPVRIDQVSHAANQIYRWEHRWDQVTEEEVMSDVKMAAPKLVELVLNGGMTPGTRQDDARNPVGQVWLYNIESGLNIIVQVKEKEQSDHSLKVVVVTVLRQKGMTWSRGDDMPKITISSTEARIVATPRNFKK